MFLYNVLDVYHCLHHHFRDRPNFGKFLALIQRGVHVFSVFGGPNGKICFLAPFSFIY